MCRHRWVDRNRRVWALPAILALLVGFAPPDPLPGAEKDSATPDAAAPTVAGSDTPDDAGEPPAANSAVIIPINGEISDVTFESIQRRVDAAKAKGVKIVVFEIDTPGGYVTSALEICDYIKNLHNVKTVAWINTQAYSAGSMIAVACDEIVMARASVLGDCGVILGGPTGPQEVPEGIRAKAESPVLEQFRDSAAKHGYDALLCESMVVKEIEVYWVENTETGEKRFINADDKEKLLEGDRKTTILGVEFPSSGKREPPWRLVETFKDPITGADTKIDQPVVKKTELLTMSQSRAYAFGFSKGIVIGEEDLRSRYHISGEIATVDFTWSEVLTRWLTSLPVRGFLMIVIFLGAYVEFNTPGVGVAGLVALIALAIFVGAPYLTGLASIWEVVLIVAGLLLLAIEIFVIPGFGVAGLSGVLLLIVGLLATFVPDEPGRFPIHWPTFQPGIEGLKRGVQTLAASLVLSIVGMVLISRYLPQMPYLRSIVPSNPTPADVIPDDPYRGVARVGDIGTVFGVLRPAGKARFGATLVDVVSQGEMIAGDERVEVIERYGNRVVVRRVPKT